MPPNDASTAAELVAVSCPRCQAGFSAEVTTIVDAADESVRSDLLAGRLNVVSCPNCGNSSRVTTLLLYLDRTAEIAFVLVPDALGLSRDEQERRIGRLTNRAVNRLPAEERRMYMLQPRTFVTDKTFFEAVLEANGVNPEEVKRIQDSARLVESLLDATDEESLARRLAEAGRTADQELVALTHALARDATAQGDAPRAAALEGLRDRLSRLAGPAQISLDELLAGLREARAAGQLPEAAAALAPVLDYSFYSQLTDRIAATDDPEERDELTALRGELVAAADTAERKARAEFERGMDTLRAVLQSPDRREAVERRLPALDTAFFLAIESALQDAGRRGDRDSERQLTELLDLAVELVEGRMPPRDRLVNRLARAATDADRARLLDDHAELLDADLERTLRSAAFDLRAGGADTQAEALRWAADELARRLTAVSQGVP